MAALTSLLRPTSLMQKRNQHQLEVEIEDMGASLNAYTSREQTCYFAKVPPSPPLPPRCWIQPEPALNHATRLPETLAGEPFAKSQLHHACLHQLIALRLVAHCYIHRLAHVRGVTSVTGPEARRAPGRRHPVGHPAELAPQRAVAGARTLGHPPRNGGGAHSSRPVHAIHCCVVDLFAVKCCGDESILIFSVKARQQCRQNFALLCVQVESIPEEVVFDHLHATAFQGTPLARTILGPAENIRSITREHLSEYIAKNYTAPRMVRCPPADQPRHREGHVSVESSICQAACVTHTGSVCNSVSYRDVSSGVLSQALVQNCWQVVSAAGAVDHDAVVQLAEKAFSGLSSDPTTAMDLIKAVRRLPAAGASQLVSMMCKALDRQRGLIQQ